MPLSDRDALPALMDVMTAAGHHDPDACLAHLDAAEAALGERFHQSRAAIHEARNAVTDHDFLRAYRNAYQATCTLTFAFPPDPSRCPPVPVETPFSRDGVCVCGHELAPVANFCEACGARRA